MRDSLNQNRLHSLFYILVIYYCVEERVIPLCSTNTKDLCFSFLCVSLSSSNTHCLLLLYFSLKSSLLSVIRTIFPKTLPRNGRCWESHSVRLNWIQWYKFYCWTGSVGVCEWDCWFGSYPCLLVIRGTLYTNRGGFIWTSSRFFTQKTRYGIKTFSFRPIYWKIKHAHIFTSLFCKTLTSVIMQEVFSYLAEDSNSIFMFVPAAI